MKLSDIRAMVRNLIPITGQMPNLNAVVLTGESGTGKSSALYAECVNRMAEIVADERGYYDRTYKSIPFDKQEECLKESKRRVIFIPLGTMDDVVGLHGMPCIVRKSVAKTRPATDAERAEGKASFIPYTEELTSLEFLKPEEKKILWAEPKTPKILIVDELNRVENIKLMNSIQTFLDSGDRWRHGISNCFVFGTRNPSDSADYSGTEQEDKAFEFRIINYKLNFSKEDIHYVSELRNWDDAVVDAAVFAWEDEQPEKKSNAAIFRTPRLMEQCSEIIKAFRGPDGNGPKPKIQDLEAVCKEDGKAFAAYVNQALNGTLFKPKSLEDLYKMSKEEISKLGIAQTIATFRKTINENSAGLKVGKLENRNNIKKLGDILDKVPANIMAAIHTRYNSNSNIIQIWSENSAVAEKIRNIKDGIDSEEKRSRKGK